MKINNKNIIGLFTLLLLISLNMKGETLSEVQKRGQDLYVRNCKSCHGDISKGNYLALKPLPGDLQETFIAKQSNESLYSKIAKGVGQMMPAYETILSKKEIQELIAYIRTFHKDYKAEPIAIDKNTSTQAALEMHYSLDTLQWILNVKFSQDSLGEKISVPDLPVGIFVKRYFAWMQLSPKIMSNKNGELSFALDKSLPSDSLNQLELKIKILPESLFEGKSFLFKIEGRKASSPCRPIKERTLWGTAQQAPLWLVFIFWGSLILVWSFVFYFIYRLLVFKKN